MVKGYILNINKFNNKRFIAMFRNIFFNNNILANYTYFQYTINISYIATLSSNKSRLLLLTTSKLKIKKAIIKISTLNTKVKVKRIILKLIIISLAKSKYSSFLNNKVIFNTLSFNILKY